MSITATTAADTKKCSHSFFDDLNGLTPAQVAVLKLSINKSGSLFS
jgi:hypothetical protein